MDELTVRAGAVGFFTRGEALAIGHDDKSIDRALRGKLWVRIRPGAYTLRSTWQQLDLVERHRVTSRAVLRRLGPHVALSHASAAVAHGMDLWGVDLTMVHVTRLDGGAGRHEAGVHHHEGFLVEDDLIETEHGLVVAAARAAAETALLCSTEAAVVVLDAALRSGSACAADVETACGLLGSWPGARHLHVARRLCDGRSGSVGESRARFLCYAHALPAPELQYEVHDAGALVGATDFAWPAHGLLGEFDGRIKYGRLLRPGESPTDAVVREKIREDRLRELTGWPMIRLTWGDLSRGPETAARIRRLMRPGSRASARPLPTANTRSPR